MVDAVTGIKGSGPVATQLSASASAPATDSVDIVRAQANAISPRLKADPVAGVIVQFLDDKGEISTQFPSKAVVAYIRAGLSEDGSPREEPHTV